MNEKIKNENNGCVLIPKKEYDELISENTRMRKELENKDLKIKVNLEIDGRYYPYERYNVVQISDNSTFTVSEGLSIRIRNFIKNILKDINEQHIKLIDKFQRDTLYELEKSFKNEFDKEKLSFIEKLSYKKTFKHLENILTNFK